MDIAVNIHSGFSDIGNDRKENAVNNSIAVQMGGGFVFIIYNVLGGV
jgi:hypothetical protein